MDKERLITSVLKNWDELTKNSKPWLIYQNLKKIDNISTTQECEYAIELLINSDVFIKRMEGEAVSLSIIGKEVVNEYNGDYAKYIKNKNSLTIWEKFTRVGAFLAILLTLFQFYQFVFDYNESVDYEYHDDLIDAHTDSIHRIQGELKLIQSELDTINDLYLKLNSE